MVRKFRKLVWWSEY